MMVVNIKYKIGIKGELHAVVIEINCPACCPGVCDYEVCRPADEEKGTAVPPNHKP